MSKARAFLDSALGRAAPRPAEEPAAAAGAASADWPDRRMRSIRSLLQSASSCSLVLLIVVMHDAAAAGGVGPGLTRSKLSRAAASRTSRSAVPRPRAAESARGLDKEERADETQMAGGVTWNIK